MIKDALSLAISFLSGYVMLFYDLKEKTGYSRSQFKTLLRRNGFKIYRNMFTVYEYTSRPRSNSKKTRLSKQKSVHRDSNHKHYHGHDCAEWIDEKHVYRIQRITKWGGAIDVWEAEKFKVGDIVIYRTKDFDVLKTSKWRRYEYEVFLFDDFVKRFCKKNVIKD